METKVIAIGKAKGIRLSKTLLERYNIQGKGDLVFEAEHIILRPVAKRRKGWDAAFNRMRKSGDDALLMPDVFADEDVDA